MRRKEGLGLDSKQSPRNDAHKTVNGVVCAGKSSCHGTAYMHTYHFRPVSTALEVTSFPGSGEARGDQRGAFPWNLTTEAGSWRQQVSRAGRTQFRAPASGAIFRTCNNEMQSSLTHDCSTAGRAELAFFPATLQNFNDFAFSSGRAVPSPSSVAISGRGVPFPALLSSRVPCCHQL